MSQEQSPKRRKSVESSRGDSMAQSPARAQPLTCAVPLPFATHLSSAIRTLGAPQLLMSVRWLSVQPYCGTVSSLVTGVPLCQYKQNGHDHQLACSVRCSIPDCCWVSTAFAYDSRSICISITSSTYRSRPTYSTCSPVTKKPIRA